MTRVNSSCNPKKSFVGTLFSFQLVKQQTSSGCIDGNDSRIFLTESGSEFSSSWPGRPAAPASRQPAA
jgi:hypothetical protein